MSVTYETDGPEFERDWHQEDKDNRAQGLDRDPEPPEDDRWPPLDVDVIEELCITAMTEKPFSAALRKALGYPEDRPDTPGEAVNLLLGVALPQLIEQRRRDEEELAEWKALPFRDEFRVYMPGSDDCEGSWVAFDTAEKTLAAVERVGGKPQTRRFFDGQWVDLETSPF